jgi:uncharacterized protein YaaQ
MMKMIMAVIPRDQSNQLLQSLVEAGYSATFTESRGGMLRQSQQMLFIVVDEDQVEGVLEIFHGGQDERSRHAAEEKEISRSGRVVFVWNIERVETC